MPGGEGRSENHQVDLAAVISAENCTIFLGLVRDDNDE